ncbi:hypothetical protein AAFF_G00398870 [Aldrovandia affinis]|uniref:Uncharacterized protein n=1 Tax=Aldrovandia affinis TaxID=143900 RepID=A0AAD7SD40_9TELE|nr:hypothetical protein AAFF_G00398870 [Aldrovandia affinis]
MADRWRRPQCSVVMDKFVHTLPNDAKRYAAQTSPTNLDGLIALLENHQETVELMRSTQTDPPGPAAQITDRRRNGSSRVRQCLDPKPNPPPHPDDDLLSTEILLWTSGPFILELFRRGGIDAHRSFRGKAMPLSHHLLGPPGHCCSKVPDEGGTTGHRSSAGHGNGIAEGLIPH